MLRTRALSLATVCGAALLAPAPPALAHTPAPRERAPRPAGGPGRLRAGSGPAGQVEGGALAAASLPDVVVPGASPIWTPEAHGIRGGTVAAIIYRNQVQYTVVGDTGPTDAIGEASYAAAVNLGINPDPVRGGAAGEVTYILFKNTAVSPIESHRAAVALGEAQAKKFLAVD
ncbi:glycoside hydrolase family 75 protein [Streptomyces sp. NPDC004685]